jgi:alpha-tubulin suppressor-like RCC1 family protein
VFGQLGRETTDKFDAAPAAVEQDFQAPVLDLCCGEAHSLLVLADRTVWVWGRGTQVSFALY